jgi:hypothetical protein
MACWDLEKIGMRADFLKLTLDEAFKSSATLESLDPWPECSNCCREEGDDQWGRRYPSTGQ